MTRSRYRFFETECPYFMANTVVAWLPVFANPKFVNIVLDSWRFLMKERDIQILGWVMLENHLHWIALGDGLPTQVGRFKSYTARQIIDEMERSGWKTMLQELRYFKDRHKTDQEHQLWQEGSHPKQILNDEMLIQKLEYSHFNPVRRGYVDDPIHWRYSSARNYAGMPGLLDVWTDWK